MQRRDFLKVLCSAVSLAIPLEVSAGLTIVDIKLTDGFSRNMKWERTPDGFNVTLDTGEIWKAVRMVDSDGREWSTDDRGKTWKCGLMSFSLGDGDEHNQPAA